MSSFETGFDVQAAKAAGYSDAEIADYLNSKREPIVSEPFINRMARGDLISDVMKKIGTSTERIGTSAAAGFGDAPLGFAPSSEMTMFFEKIGLFNDPATGRASILRTATETGIRPLASGLDLIGRTFKAGFYGVGAVAGLLAEAEGATPVNAMKLQRDVSTMAEMAMLLAGTGPPIHRVKRMPDGRMVEEPLGGLPTRQDFVDATNALTKGAFSPEIEAKLLGLYEKHGFHPAELVEDVKTNPVLLQQLLAKGDHLPEELVGLGPPKAPAIAPESASFQTEKIARYKEWDRLKGQVFADTPEQTAARIENWMKREDLEDAGLGKHLAPLKEDPTNRQHLLDLVKDAVEGDKGAQNALNQLRGDKHLDELITRAEEAVRYEQELSEWLQKNKAIDPGMGLEPPPKAPGEPGEPGLPVPKPGEPPAPGGPGEPPKPPGPLGPEPPPEPPPFKRTGTSPNYEAALDEVLSKVSVDEQFAKKVRPGLIEMTVDKLWPLKKARNEAVEKGLKLEPAEDPYILGRLFSGWAGKAEVMLKYEGPFDFFSYDNVGPSLKEILAPIKDEMRDFRGFAVAARAAELENKGVKSGFGSRMDAAKVLVDEAPPHYKKALLQMVAYMNQVTAYYRDSGMLSRAGYDAMIEGNKLYVPWFRLFEEEGVMVPGNNLQSKQIKRTIEGADTAIIDPLESIVKSTFLMVAHAEKNVVAGATVNMLKGADQIAAELKPVPGRDLVKVGEREYAIVPVEAAPGEPRSDLAAMVSRAIRRSADRAEKQGHVSPEFIDMLDAVGQPLKPNEIRVFENGVPKLYRVDEDVARVIKNLDPEGMHFLLRMMGVPARMLRAGAVMVPDFWARHLFRENIYAATTWAKEGVYTPADQIRGIGGMIKGDPDFVDWMKGGGGHVTMVSLDRNILQHNLRELTADTGLMTRAWNVVGHPISMLQAGTEVALSATHLGAFKKRMRQIEAESAKPKPLDAVAIEGPIADAPRLGRLNPETLPDTLKGRDLRLKPGVDVLEGLKAFDYVDGKFVDVQTTNLKGKKDIIDAAYTSRDTSIDNARIGSKMRALNNMSAFLNAKIQDSTRGVAESMARNPGKYMLMTGAGIVMPSMITWWWGKDDSRYRDAPSWQRDLFWVIPTDKWEKATPHDLTTVDEDGKIQSVRPSDQVRIMNGQLEVNNGIILRFPKPFLPGVMFGSGTERLMDAYYQQNPDAFRGFFNSIFESTVGELTPQIVIPFAEQALNKTRLSSRSLIPHQLEGTMPEYQFTPYTTELSKKLGMAVSAIPGVHALTSPSQRNVTEGLAASFSSPILLENYVRQWTGTLGMYLLATADLAARKAGVLDDPPKALGTLADIPIIKAFVMRHPTGDTQSIQQFYDMIDETKRMHTTWLKKAREGDLEAMERISNVGGDGVFMQFDSMKKVIGTQSELIHQTHRNPDIPAQEKRQLIDSYYYTMQALGRTGKEMLRDIKQALDEKTPP